MTQSSKRIPAWFYIVGIVISAIAAWHGAIESSFTPDDYVLIHTISPIRSLFDVFATFVRHDPNPQYWRPLTNATYAFDFLLWGWNGYLFHLSNILLHCSAAITTFYFIRSIFKTSNLQAFLVAALFALSCSHDSNILWLSARTDVIATLLMMLTILAEKKVRTSSIKWSIVSFILFFLALSAKEISIILLALLPLLSWSDSPIDLWKKKRTVIIKLLPYIALTIVFFYIHSFFTVPLSQMQPLQAEGSRSVIAFLKNATYSIGYILFPVDFQTASTIINRHAVLGYSIVLAIIVASAITLYTYRTPSFFLSLYKPGVLLLISGIVSFQSFERWRVYFPSIGLLVIVLLCASLVWTQLRSPYLKGGLILIAVALTGFHLQRSLYETQVWSQANQLIRQSEQEFGQILGKYSKRPITFLSIGTPIKLGSAQILQVAGAYAMVKAEATLSNEPGLVVGNLGGATTSVDLTTVVSSFAFNPEKGFSELTIEQRSPREFLVICKDNSLVSLFPAIIETKGVASRDQEFENGSVIQSNGAIITILKAQGSFVSEALITITDTSVIPLLFDGSHFRVANQ